MKTEVIKPMPLKSGTVVPAGTTVAVTPSESPAFCLVDWGGAKKIAVRYTAAHRFLRGFHPPPRPSSFLRTVVCESKCKTPTGRVVEPDGTDPDGFPSWLLVFGLI